MNKPKLYIMCGISASGKSTIAKQIAEKDNCIIISSDNIRGEICEGGVSDQSKNEEVFKIFHKRIRENILIGNNVIADATNITIKSRKSIFNIVNNIDCEKIGCIVIKKIEDCLRDNKNNDRNPVPEEVIHKQVRKFQIPFMEEGWDNIKFYQPYVNSEYHNIIGGIVHNMKDFNQNNPHHSQTLLEHCNYTYNQFLTKYNYPWKYRLAAKIHDCGKLYTQTFDEKGVAHYYGHENYGSYMMLTYINDLILGHTLISDEILDFLFLINYHMLPMNWDTNKSIEKWRKIFGDYKYKLLLDFNKCDKMRPDINIQAIQN